MRSLLALMVIVAVWMGLWILGARRQQELVAWVLKHKGDVEFEYNEHADDWKPYRTWWFRMPKKWRPGLARDLEWDVTMVRLAEANDADLRTLAELNKLERLDLSGTDIANLEPLAGMKYLRRLDLSGTAVADLRPLAGMQQLERLNLHNTQVADLRPLAGLVKLEILDLRGTRITNLEPLRGLQQLASLHACRTQVSDLSPLVGLKNLSDLQIVETRADRSQLVRLQEKLPSCRIVRNLWFDGCCIHACVFKLNQPDPFLFSGLPDNLPRGYESD